MPGGRLTYEDRRFVAAGLGEGRGYAEIARQLGRPTSTVTREVARNGGPHGYRPVQAQQASERRARRRRTAPPADRTEDPASAAAQAFVERFATLMVQTGLPRMAARVFAALVTSDPGAMTAAELVRHLRVSPASVSKAVGYLEGLDMVRRRRDGRRERYGIDDGIWLQSWLTSARTNATLAEVSQQGTEVFDPGTPAGARLARMNEFFAQLSEDMSGGPAFAEDMLTVAAAVSYAGRPVTAAQLAAALDWPAERVAEALRKAGERPDFTDPVVLRPGPAGTHTIETRLDRLTTAQLAALRP